VTQHVHVTEAEPVDPNPPAHVTEFVDAGNADEVHTERRSLWPGRREFLGTLGARLVAGVLILVIAIVLATGSATYLALRSYLDGRLASQLDSTSGSPQITSALSPMTYTRGQLGPSPQKVWLVVLNTNGTLYDQQTNGSNAELMSLTPQQRTSLVHQPGAHVKLTTASDEHLMVVANSGRVGLRGSTTGDDVVFVVGLSTDEISRTLHRLVVVEAAIGLGALVLAFAATSWGVGVGLRPLKRVTRTAQEVTAELSPAGAGLERRVPETDSSTEVGQLAMSFNTMLDTVQTEFTARRESEERMRQFLADASHELRTPLTSIRGYAELARMQKARNDANGIVTADDGTDDTIGRIETEGTRMSRLVEDLLILARGDDQNDNSAEREVVELDEVVQDAITDLRLGYPDRIVSTDIQPGLRVTGDRDQLLRLVRNLTVNAAVHTDADGPIRVTAQRDADNVVVQVIDAGPGLAPEEAAHVFERFWRADRARTRVRGGSGLGMAIVAQIVSAHGGRAFFDSSVPGGSTVTLVLPAIA
jgi:two-component system OmpR family sensor kinase